MFLGFEPGFDELESQKFQILGGLAGGMLVSVRLAGEADDDVRTGPEAFGAGYLCSSEKGVAEVGGGGWQSLSGTLRSGQEGVGRSS